MSSPTVNREELEGALRRSLKDHWQIFTVQGVLLVLLGLAAIAVPQIASVALAAFIGWLLFLAGAMRAVSLFRSPHAPGYWPSLLLAILTAILGLVLALFPIQGALTLSLVLVAYFVVQGVSSFMLAFSIKGDTSRWILLLIGGIIDFALAAMVLSKWPATGVWILGLFVGINMLFTGFALIFAALDARKA